jgi:uncharacterized secreted protein with C-terminal beta-propeller domain
MERNEDYIQELNDEIDSLKNTISDLKDYTIDLNHHIDNCKQIELIEFIKDVKSSIQMENYKKFKESIK